MTLLQDIGATHSLRRLEITTKASAIQSAALHALGDAIKRHTDLQYLRLAGIDVDILDAPFLNTLSSRGALTELHLLIKAGSHEFTMSTLAISFVTFHDCRSSHSG